MFKEQAKKVLRIEAEAITALIDRIDNNLVKALDIIYSCPGRVVVTGMGKSGLIGKKLAATLASTGTPAIFLHPAEGGHGDIGMVSKGDVVIAISNSGETDEIITILPVLKRLDIKLISFTGSLTSTLAKISDVVLDVSVKEEACPMGLVPTASTTAALAMGDALAVALLSKRGFSEEDFAFFHPGGNLGRRLLLTAGELMHRGDSIPSVKEEITMKDAIMEISSKRLGITTVINESSQLLGIITDGDLRRGLEKWDEKFFSLKARDVMTHNPRTIARDTLAVKALSIMETYSITSLVIIDLHDRVEGIVHLHDILKSGIV
ncbi:MAG: KpsF/GutQ family sugar-phosphate isomerase [Thermodesulfovibrionia bacterium]|nr:KpsF/GutQ family sugar-phosphate isomerase [Thermodesulfovibrionia bacterium]MCK5426403.1 KpsF/GutQ family sugar-phosphate isomerase [Thermodesulfovibrionia bacterium]